MKARSDFEVTGGFDRSRSLFGLPPQDVSREITRYVTEVTGVRRIPYDMRHTAAQRLADVGANRLLIAEFLTHDNINTANAYIENSPAQAEIVNRALGQSPVFQKLDAEMKRRSISRSHHAKLDPDQQVMDAPNGYPIVGIGGCKIGQSFCTKTPALACYTCPKFMFLRDDVEVHRNALAAAQSIVREFLEAAPTGRNTPAFTQLTQTIERRQAGLYADGAPLHRTVEVFAKRSREDGMPWRDALTAEPVKPRQRFARGGMVVCVSDLEDFLIQKKSTKVSDQTPFLLSSGRTLPTHELLFLHPKRALNEGRNGGVCDITRYPFVGHLQPEDIQSALQSSDSDEVALAFLAESVDQVQLTPYGVCTASFVSEACPKHLTCLNGCYHLVRTSDAKTVANNRKLLARFDALLDQCPSVETETAAQKTWREKLATDVERLRRLVAAEPGQHVFPEGDDHGSPYAPQPESLL